jgi:hypothetical protein
MSMSPSARAERPTQSSQPRLHLVEALTEKKHRNRVLSVLANGALSLRRRLRLAQDSAARFGFVRRLTGWWSRLRSWLRPAVAVVRAAGIALPIWILTDARAQKLIGAGARSVASAARECLHLSSDLVTWVLWRLGGFGQDLARRYGFFVERVETVLGALGERVAGWLRVVHADRLYMQIIHDLAGVLGLIRALAGLVPGPWRVAAGLIAFIAVGGAARAQLVVILQRLVGGIQSRFSAFRSKPTGSPAMATAGASTQTARPAQARSNRSRQRSRRRR